MTPIGIPAMIVVIENGGALFIGQPETGAPVELAPEAKQTVLEALRLLTAREHGRDAGEVAREIAHLTVDMAEALEGRYAGISRARLMAIAEEAANKGIRSERAEAEKMRKALSAVKLTEMSCHGSGGRLVCQGCGKRADDFDDIPHKPGCWALIVHRALGSQSPSGKEQADG